MVKNINIKVDWLYLFILLSPLFYIYGADYRMSQTMFFQYSVMVLLAIFHVNKWLGAFLAWGVFQAIFFKDIPDNSSALNNLFLGLAAYQTIVIFCRGEEAKKYFKVFLIVVGINLLWCLRQFYQADPLFSMMNIENQRTFTEYPAFFGLPAFLGNYVSVIVPMAILINPALVVLCLIGLFLSKSTFSCAAALGAALFYFWFRKRIVFWGILLLGGLSFLVYAAKVDYPTGQFSRRLNVWRAVETVSLRSPFFGKGIGSFQGLIVGEETSTGDLIVTRNPAQIKPFLIAKAREKKNFDIIQALEKENSINGIRAILQSVGMDFERWQNSHNDYLETFFETGILGMFLIFGYIVSLFRRFLEWGRECPLCLTLMSSFVGILIVSVGHFPFHLARLGSEYLVIMALLEVCLIQAQKVKEQGW